MEPSGIYVAIQDMIENGFLGMLFSDFANTLVILEEKGLLTEEELTALLTLANNRKESQGIHAWPPRPGPYFPISGERNSTS